MLASVLVAACAAGGGDDSGSRGRGAQGEGDSCPDDGLYCGGDQVGGDPSTLYRCSDHTLSIESACANGCNVQPAPTDDFCNAAPASECPNDGLYCGGDGVGGDASILYRCTAHHLAIEESCSSGCSVQPAGVNDRCASSAPPPPAGGDDSVARALEWVSVSMPYCGGINGGTDVLCGGTCWRSGAASNPAWDGYRSDCSGLVSWAWGLPRPGRTTYGFAPFDDAVSYEIAGSELQAGDALNNTDHVVLFAGWIDRASGRARIIEEYDCGHVATDHVLTLSVDGSPGVYISDWSPHAYRAIRHRR